MLVQPLSVPAIASELERVADHLEYWCRSSTEELAVPLADALQAVHRTIFAVREAESAGETGACADQWLG